ncbi:hypothetical protein BLNAU_16639 [Blattamonas nauphoetae]|uniref:RRM domain-containing protein n=1 Tax=Blattamonas nauphoetae TaxID=2049346 RepID=A0ABQ9XC90_9EUKA|nr:hypothetical protein BLNAU_16639 [Blattamonas nauphoetae]
MTETTVQVSEIPLEHTLDIVAGYFSQCGRISSLKLIPDPKRPDFQIAIITFMDDTGMENALTLSASPTISPSSIDKDEDKPPPLQLFEPVPLRPVRATDYDQEPTENSSFFAQLQADIISASRRIQDRLVTSESDITLSNQTTAPTLLQRFSNKLNSLFTPRPKNSR